MSRQLKIGTYLFSDKNINSLRKGGENKEGRERSGTEADRTGREGGKCFKLGRIVAHYFLNNLMNSINESNNNNTNNTVLLRWLCRLE